MATKLNSVRVEWVDSMSDPSWSEPSMAAGQCSTAGFLVGRSKDTVSVALNYCHAEGATKWGHTINIPMCSVRRITKLK